MKFDNNERITIITGHFGSGKTEFSINYAKYLSKQIDKKIALIDLDIINTYFRAREHEDSLKKENIQVLSTAFKVTTLDIPALDPAIEGAIIDKSKRVIIDVGGNPSGARALGRYNHVLDMVGYEQVFVVNANRPETATADQVIDFIERTQNQSQTKISWLVNTTHMLKNTSVEDILKGEKLLREVSQKTGIPIWCTAVLESLVDEVKKADPSINVFPISLYFRDDWML
ncbi:MAG: ATP-binding protein [Tissierellia bacterium]|nr:ATP-binding protein [Tissierellia bacterium]